MSTYYTEDHEWIRVEGETATVGVTDFAQKQLGDVVFVELPDVGKTLKQGDEAAVVESVKAASEVYAPISGAITSVNEALSDAPATINEAAETDGWFLTMTVGNAAELEALMDEAAYKAFLETL